MFFIKCHHNCRTAELPPRESPSSIRVMCWKDFFINDSIWDYSGSMSQYERFPWIDNEWLKFEKKKTVWLEVWNNLSSFILNSEAKVMKVVEFRTIYQIIWKHPCFTLQVSRRTEKLNSISWKLYGMLKHLCQIKMKSGRSNGGLFGWFHFQ